MIYELSSEGFDKCQELINTQGQLEVKAVISRTNPGRVFTDDLTSPRSALIWFGNLDGFCFIGDANNMNFNREIPVFIDQMITPAAIKLGLEWFECFGNHSDWDPTIKNMFQNRQLGSWDQNVYSLNRANYLPENEPDLQDEYTLIKMTRRMFNLAIDNLNFPQNIILNHWGTMDNFFTYGMGYCIIYQQEIVSLCYSGFVDQATHAIGVETLGSHRGNKLAQKAAHAFVKECFERGYLPYWDCMESNKPSIAVAKSIGFMKAFGYTGYEFPF